MTDYDMKVRERLIAALAKPIAEDRYCVEDTDFDPWADIIKGISGSYSSESDMLMIAALEAVLNRTTFEFIEKEGFVAEFALYVLSGHDLLEYGTSPRGGWPLPAIADLWQPLIDKWRAYAEAQYGGYAS